MYKTGLKSGLKFMLHFINILVILFIMNKVS